MTSTTRRTSANVARHSRAALGILAWPPLHVVGLALFGSEVPQVIGAVLQAVGFAGCAAALWRDRSYPSIPASVSPR